MNSAQNHSTPDEKEAVLGYDTPSSSEESVKKVVPEGEIHDSYIEKGNFDHESPVKEDFHEDIIE